MWRLFGVALAIAGFLLPFAAWGAIYDVQIQRSDITLRPEQFFVGDLVRVYATVKNIGDKDVQGNVFFSENGTAIGTPPPFSVKAKGAEEEVWVDWQPVVAGDRQIFVRVVTAPETRDEDVSNNEMIVPIVVAPRPPSPALPTPTTATIPLGSGSVFSPGAGVSSTATSISAVPATGVTSSTAAAATASSTVSGGATKKEKKKEDATVVASPHDRKEIAQTPSASTLPTPAAAEETTPVAIANRTPYDMQLRDLLGGPAAGWRAALPFIAGGIAVIALLITLALWFRRRPSHDADARESLGRRPPRAR